MPYPFEHIEVFNLFKCNYDFSQLPPASPGITLQSIGQEMYTEHMERREVIEQVHHAHGRPIEGGYP